MIERETLASYLERTLGRHVEIHAVRRLGVTGEGADDPKAFGYGVPLEVACRVDGTDRAFVVARTRPARGFGHDYPADRAWQALYAHVAYNSFPRHVQSLDVGFIRTSGDIVSAGDAAEFFQLVEKAEGAPYWLDLARLLEAPVRDLDVARVEALARFLAVVHRDKRDEPSIYQRRIRELVGHGECLMGILDSYPHPYPFLSAETCEAIEREAVGWRWRLRARAHRLSRVHGDFHPWNLLFREETDFSVLDRSRGEWGEPADDVAALGINYLFFALRRRDLRGDPGEARPLLDLFATFVETYLATSGDDEILEVLPPFLAFRALVIAHPRWYPTLTGATRASLVTLAGRMMTAPRFDPRDPERLVGGWL